MMNKLKNRVTLLWGNTPLRYCFSFSLIASGVLFSFISINVVSREIMVDITIAAGLVLISNFNKVWYQNFFVKLKIRKLLSDKAEAFAIYSKSISFNSFSCCSAFIKRYFSINICSFSEKQQ